MSIGDWIDETSRAGSSRLGQLSLSPTTSNMAPNRASRARSTCSTYSATRGGASSASSARRTRSTTSRRQRPDHRPYLRMLSGPDHVGSERIAHQAERDRDVHAHVQAGSGRRRYGGEGRAHTPFSILREVDHSKAGFEPLQLTGDRGAGYGHEFEAAPAVHEDATGTHSGGTGRRSPTGVPEHVGGHARSRRARGSRQLHRRENRRELRLGNGGGARATSSWGGSSRCSGRTKAWNGRRRSTSGAATAGRWAHTRTGGLGSTGGSPGMAGRRQGSCFFAGEHTSTISRAT